MQWPQLADFPLSARVALTAYLLTTGLGYNYAIANVAMKIGTSPNEVAVHYRGGKLPAKDAPKPAEAPAPAAPAEAKEEEFDLGSDDPVEAPPPAPAEIDKPAPSLGALVQEGHTHIFGMGSLFFGVVAVALFLRLREGLKALLVALPFVGIVLDHLGFLATRFLGPGWVTAVMVAGILMSLTHLVVTVLGCAQMWLRRAPAPAPQVSHA